MFIRLPSYLNNNCLDDAHVCLPRRMMLHILAGCLHRDQNARVGCHDNAAWKDVAEDEQCHSVGACCRVLIGQAPVNATGGAIRLWSIFPPVGQRGAGKQQGIGPSTGNEQTAVNRVKPVPCENTLGSYFIIHEVLAQLLKMMLYISLGCLITLVLHACSQKHLKAKVFK